MSTITRERLLKIQQWRETYGAGSNVMLPAEEAEELARIALASLEAAPVGEVSEKRYGLVMDGTVDLGGESTYRIIKGEKAMKRLPLGTKFYIAPPAPVVPDDWVMVPKEPTRQMMAQGHFAMKGTDRGKFRRIYQAMITAAPDLNKGGINAE